MSTLKEEQCSNLHLNADDEEIEILEENDVKPLTSKSSPNQQHISHLPPLNEASTFIKEMAAQVKAFD